MKEAKERRGGGGATRYMEQIQAPVPSHLAR
jgi:hypothetical protein